MTAIVGIDLGTTNSAIAVLDRTGKPEIVENSDGESITPSVVYFESDATSTVVVGTAAKNSDILRDGRSFKEFKRRMPQSANSPLGNAELQVTPVQLSSFVLKKLLKDASARLGAIGKVVVTVPANFANEARLATIRAGELAGYTIDDIVNEPTAALLCYSMARPITGKVMVYDFGGGTLDVTVAQVRGRDIQILTSKGDPKLGGADFDKRLTDLIAKKFEATTGERLDPAIHTIGKTSEEYKKHLSSREDVAVQVAGGTSGRSIFKITRKEFENSSATLISKADLLVESALDEANIRPTDISDVFLVGGSTRMPMIKEHLTKLFGREPVCHLNPDEVVALGAALYAGYKEDPAKLNAAQVAVAQSVQLREVANHYFGTLVLGRDAASGRAAKLVSPIIDKNTPLPCSKTEAYYTVREGQTGVNCEVTQSTTRESDPDFVRIIWSGSLGPLPEGRPAEMEIRVTFSYDSNQVMHCRFEDVATGMAKEVNIGLKDDEVSTGHSIDKFLVE